MSLRALLGFEHLPQGIAAWTGTAPYGLTRVGRQTSTLVDGWIVGGTGANNVGQSHRFPVAEYSAAPVKKFSCAVRIKSMGTAAVGNWQVLRLFFPAIRAIFTTRDLNNALAIPVGTVRYLEFTLDIETGVVERWVDGVKIEDLPPVAATVGLRPQTLDLYDEVGYNQRNNWRDIIITDDIDNGDGITGVIGERTLRPIGISAAEGVDWVPSSGTLLSALDPLAAADYVTSPGSKTDLKVRLKPINWPGGVRVDAIQLGIGGKNTASGNSMTGFKLVYAGQEKRLPTVPLSPTLTYNKSITVSSKAPDNDVWTEAKLAATDLILTPEYEG